jgi:hypothetical protein
MLSVQIKDVRIILVRITNQAEGVSLSVHDPRLLVMNIVRVNRVTYHLKFHVNNVYVSDILLTQLNEHKQMSFEHQGPML